MGINRKSKSQCRKFLSFLAVLCLTVGLVLLMPITASANPSIFGGGNGGASTPFLINNLEQLEAFRDSVNSGTSYQGQHIWLNVNLDLSGIENWVPIGISSTNPFRGTFNGRRHIVNGLHINTTSGTRGFFGRIAENGTVLNLRMTGVNITGSSAIGGIAGENQGSVENCYVEGTVTGTSGNVGGVVGLMWNTGTVRNCYVNATVSGSSHIGGIAGNNGGRVINCFALGTVNATTGSAGGIAGIFSGTTNGTTVEIANCVALQTNITSADASIGRIAGRISVGQGVTVVLNNNRANSALTTRHGSSLTSLDGLSININTTANASVFSAANAWGSSIWVIPDGNINVSQPSFQLFSRTVTYLANGGTGGTVPIHSTTHHDGTNITVLGNTGNLTREGLAFVGWNTQADGSGTSVSAGSSFTINGNARFYAQWKALEPILITDVNDETNSFTVESDNLDMLFEHPVDDPNKGVTEEEMQPGNTVLITLNISETCDDADGAAEIIYETRGRLLQFFEITVAKTVTTPTETTITPLRELPVPIQITIDLSEELSGKTGYTVYRYHGNQVQLIGMDTDADEYFTVSRGTGEEDVDQVIINTRRFSTYAVVENIVTLHDADSHEDVDVQARIVDLTAPVYRIDIAWGDMKFIYYTADYIGDWNPDNKTYENPVIEGWSGFDDINNQVIVTNRSNADVLVDFDVTDNFDNAGTVMMNIESVHAGIAKVPLPGASPLNIEAYLLIAGTPSPADITRLTNDIWHKIGIITVTITPDGDTLTPLRQ